jgi:hypothetical protein
MTLEQLGLSDSVLAELASFLSRSTSEIKVSTTFFSAYCLCELSCAIFFRIITSVVGFQNRVRDALFKEIQLVLFQPFPNWLFAEI